MLRALTPRTQHRDLSLAHRRDSGVPRLDLADAGQELRQPVVGRVQVCEIEQHQIRGTGSLGLGQVEHRTGGEDQRRCGAALEQLASGQWTGHRSHVPTVGGVMTVRGPMIFSGTRLVEGESQRHILALNQMMQAVVSRASR